MQTRTGNTETPDATWSEWQAVARDGAARDAAEARVLSPQARFIRWRVLFGREGANKASGESALPSNPAAFIEGVRLVYLPRNVRPEISAVNVLSPNVALQSLIPSGIDATGDASNLSAGAGAPSSPSPPPRRTIQRGALALQWQVEDRNGDSLEHAIYYRALDESAFRLLKDRVRDVFYTVDAQTIPDGRYLFRIVASDAPSNPRYRALTGERISEPVEIDNTPPLVRVLNYAAPSASGERRVRFQVEDATGSIRRADVSINGQAWETVFPEDGIADSRTEAYSIRVPPSAVAGETVVALRAFDRSGNTGAARVVVRR
jgi:hypothetical protein